MAAPRTLWCVDDGVPPETLTLLAAACDAEGVPFAVVSPGGPVPRPAPGDLLFRPAVSQAAMALERALWRPDLASFWCAPDGPWRVPAAAPALLARHGVATPPTVSLSSAAPAALDGLVAAVGPAPWVVKVPGAAGGHGVLRVHDRAALTALAEYLLATGPVPWLMGWVEGEHWRVVVVGEDAVAAYRNPLREKDFRTEGGLDPADVTATVPAALAAPAVAACRALGVAHGGVDLIVPPEGPPVVLEGNFPCYFAHAEQVAGVPVAAAMVRWLLSAQPPATSAPPAPPPGPTAPVWIVADDGAPWNAALLAEAAAAAGRPVQTLSAEAFAAPPPDHHAADLTVLAGWGVAAWRAACALGAVADHAPCLAALTEAAAWPPPLAPEAGGPAALLGPSGAVWGPLPAAESRATAAQSDALGTPWVAIEWRPGAQRWQVLWVHGAVIGATCAPCPGGGLDAAPPAAAPAPPAVEACAHAAAARAERPWLQITVLAAGDDVAVVGLMDPPDLSAFPDTAARAAAAARLAPTPS